MLRKGTRINKIMPSLDELTIWMPEIRYKSHFRWSLWVFFRKIQVRFKQASLATADNKQEDRMSFYTNIKGGVHETTRKAPCMKTAIGKC